MVSNLTRLLFINHNVNNVANNISQRHKYIYIIEACNSQGSFTMFLTLILLLQISALKLL